MPIKDPIKRAEYMKKYNSEHKKEHALWMREYYKKPEVRERILSQKKEYQKTDSHKESYKKRCEKIKYQLKVKQIFNKEVRLGNIKRMPCEVCGLENAEGHHEDYNKPLDVMWLCRGHHLERHRKWF